MFKTFEINDGVYLHHFKTNKFKTNTMAILISAEMKEETAAKTALCAHIMKSGSRKYPTQKALAAKLEEMYGAVFDVSIVKKGNRQLIYIFFDCVGECFEDSFDFLKEILYYPKHFYGLGFENAKRRLYAEIEAVKDVKEDYALERMASETENGAYSVPALGRAYEAAALKSAAVKKYYDKLMETGVIDIYFVGNEDAEIVRRKNERLFGRTRSNVKRIPEECFLPKFGGSKKVREEQGLNQGKLCMCFSTGKIADKKNVLALSVLNEIIGGGGESLLFSKVREKKGLCYSISSSVDKHKMIMVVEAGIDKKEYENVSEIIKNSVDELKCDITYEKLLEARKSLFKRFESVFDNPVDMINYSFSMRLLGIHDSPEKLISGIKEVKSEEVKQMAECLNCELEYFLM